MFIYNGHGHNIMTEHKVCVGCKFNNYPTCKGLVFDGIEMNIEHMRDGFICGTKDKTERVKFTKTKTESELKIDELEARILELEKK
ncbi:hypothetical protein LCGC14_1667540 [marine sediment metagenome]|uniref:Uncharacterized protein n=1 Tax=marine sediment metagenome TaxID=412755 RepID=A0A0F9K835_9ZZZZ